MLIHRITALPVVLLATTLWLPPSTATAQMKIGFVNVSRVLEVAPQAIEARNRIENEFASRDRNLLNLHNEIRELEDKLLRDAAIMSASEQQRQSEDIRLRKRNLKRLEEEFREDLNLRRSQELSSLQRKVSDVIQKLAATGNYDMVLVDGIAYVSAKIDISEKVIEYLEKEFRESQQKPLEDSGAATGAEQN